MKKWLSGFLATAVMVCALSGCNQQTKPVETTEKQTENVTVTTSAPDVTTETSTTTSVTEETTTTTQDPEKALEEEKAARMEEQYSEQREKYLKRYEKLSESYTLPIISFITLDEEEILSKEEYVTTMVDIFNCDEEYELSASAGVRVRGNSTAEGKDKPYRIKFDKKQNMLGLHDNNEYKSWVLLLSQWNLAMDYMGFSLADAILGEEYYSSDCAYVNVFVNGKYKGIYLLCEQNQAGKGRVDIYEPDEDETGTDIGYLLEIDNYASEEEGPFFTMDYLGAEITDISGKTEKFVEADYSIKTDTFSDEQRSFIEKYTKGVFEILFEAAENNTPMMFDEDYNVVSAEGTYSDAKEAAEAVIDLESLANVLIVDELVHDYDVGEGSFYMTVDFSSESNRQKLTFEAPWDFNWAYDGSPNRRYFACTFQPLANDIDRSNPWYITAMKAEWFRDIVKEKWAKLYAEETITSVTAKARDGVEELRDDLGDESWKIDSAANVIEFVDRRVVWLNKQWGAESK